MKKVFYVIGVIAIIFIITNPSLIAFKEHQGQISSKGLIRKYNFFLFSIYHDKQDYLGIIGNFFKLKSKPAAIYSDSLKVDSVATTEHFDSGINPFIGDSSELKKADKKTQDEIDKDIQQFLKNKKR